MGFIVIFMDHSKNSRTMLYHLPQETLFDILSRLPVKSLGRCKCVCKTWLSLISDSEMQQMLLARGPKVLLSSSAGLQSLDCSKTAFTDEGALVNLDFPLRKPNKAIRILGSSNGLLCISLDKDKNFFLWNPSTGVYNKLPDFGFPRMRLYGFGYDLLTNDYKVLCANLCAGHRYTYRVLETKADSWREIKNACYDSYICNRARGSFSNGTLHWLAKRRHSLDWCNAIWSFNLAQEMFCEVPMPSADGTTQFDKFTMLSVLDGCLCLFIPKRTDARVELWMMKEYRVQSSWEKLFSIADNFNQIPLRHLQLEPACLVKSAELIMISNWNELLRLKPKEMTLERLKILRSTKATAYIENLISPNIFG